MSTSFVSAPRSRPHLSGGDDAALRRGDARQLPRQLRTRRHSGSEGACGRGQSRRHAPVRRHHRGHGDRVRDMTDGGPKTRPEGPKD